MFLSVLLALSAVLATPAGSEGTPAGQDGFTSYTDDFDRFATETKDLPDDVRAKLFRERFASIVPGFYDPRGNVARFDAEVIKNLNAYPAAREKQLATARAFGAAFTSGGARLKKFFPDYRLTVPVYLLHSLGQMDGGTRTLRGQPMMIFGNDMIARLHDAGTIGPLMDHELFHIYHAPHFPECDAIWCGLWTEGLAVYVTSRMNPGASDRQLLLEAPQPIRGPVDARFAEAICLTRTKLDSTDNADIQPYFQSRPATGERAFPPRFGYYLGYRIAAEIGATMPLTKLAKLTPAQVRPRMEKALEALADCPRPSGRA